MLTLSGTRSGKHIALSWRRWRAQRLNKLSNAPKRSVITWKRRLGNGRRKKNCGGELRWDSRQLKKKYCASRRVNELVNNRLKKPSVWLTNRHSAALEKTPAGKPKNKPGAAPKKKLNCVLKSRRKCARKPKPSDRSKPKRAAARKKQ